ncbi:MAG: hypothetical protein PHX61_13525 [Alphaproteobacteria bacterium]|nr:hypothetical protein [Alphaproteobacteria bacterium]
MLEWLDYASPAGHDVASSGDMCLIYEPGHPIKVAVFRMDHGIVDISGGYSLWNIRKIARINKPE